MSLSRVELESPLENVQVTLKKEGKVAGVLTFEKDTASTLTMSALRMTRVDSKKLIVLSGGVVLTVKRSGKKVLELTADEITIKVLTLPK